MRNLLLRIWHSPTLMTWGSMASRLLGLTLVLPLVLVRFAPAEVAVWQLFSTLITLMLILDFGLSPTFSRMLSYALGGASVQDLLNIRQSKPKTDASVQDTRETVQHVYATLQWLYARLGLGIVVLAAAAGSWALIKPISQLTDPSSGWVAWAIVVVSLMGAVWGNAYAAALQGVNEIASLRRWEIAASVGQIACSFAVVALGGGLVVLVLSTQAWAVFNMWRNRRLLHRLRPELAQVRSAPHPGVMAALWPAAWRSGVGVLMSQGLIQLSGLAYGQMAAVADVASYLLALRIITTVSQFSQAPFYSKLPTLNMCYARKDIAEQLRVAQKGMLMASAVFTAGTLAAGLLAQPLLTLIHSKVQFASPSMWLLLSLAFFVERVGAMHIQLYSVTNHIVWHIANGLTGSAMLGLAWLLYPRLGIAAFPVAMLIAYSLLYTAYAMFLTSRTFKFNLLAFEARASLPFALIQLVGGGMIYLAYR
jgi:hypothetical protein